MGIKAKWSFSFLPMYTYAFFAFMYTWSGRWPALEYRVLNTVGTLLMIGILLFIVKPWTPDEQSGKSRRVGADVWYLVRSRYERRR